MIIIAPFGNITLNKPTQNFHVNCTKEDITTWFSAFLLSSEKEVTVTHLHPKKFFELFKSIFILVPAAGGVVLKEKEMLFIFRNNKWDLPKGKIETNEKPSEAAIREVEEECGITNLEQVNQLPSTFHLYKSEYKSTKGKWIFKETFWYEMNYRGIEKGEPQQEEGITKIEWFAKKDLKTPLANTYENLKQLIEIYRD